MFGWLKREEQHGLCYELDRAQKFISLQRNSAVRKLRVMRGEFTSQTKRVDEQVCRQLTVLARRSGLRVNDEYVRGVFHSMVTAGAAMMTLMVIARGTHRIRQAKDLPDRLIGSGRGFKGWVARVGDGDGLRIRHTPAIRFPYIAKRVAPKSRAVDTVSIRLAGVDAPEVRR